MTESTGYNFITLDQLYSQPLEIDWLIEDIMPSNSIGMVYGASGCGKSHIILSMAAMVANGLPWFDNDTKQGSVLVMAGEGLAGIARRIKAIEIENNLTIDRAKLHISDRAIGLDTIEGHKLVEQAIEELKEKPQIIFIDTLSRHLDESQENSNDDMARFINKLDLIRLKYKCTIVLVHHTGKSENQGARGASALKANVDFSFKVSGENKKCTFACDKMKDADDAISAKCFAIKGINLGELSSKGKPITGACVVKSNTAVSLKASLPSNDETALACFHPAKKEWQNAYIKTCTSPISDESKISQYRRARTKLIETGQVEEHSDGSYSINEAA
jgi:hypothetical protein